MRVLLSAFLVISLFFWESYAVSAASEVDEAGPEARDSVVIPARFFGMTIKDPSLAPSEPRYQTTRSWDVLHLSWAEMNPSPGVYNFSALDAFIAQNEARAVEMIYTFGRTPRWASQKPNAPSPYGTGECAPPRQVADWDLFVSAIATHARGRIRYWELWNEANNPEMWCADEGTSANTLSAMAQHAFTLLKKADPGAVVLSPSVTGQDGPRWLEWFLSVGGGTTFDVFAFHGYWSGRAEDVLPVIEIYRAILAKSGLGKVEMWDTEASWAQWNARRTDTVPLDEQVSFIPESFLLHWSEGVKRLVWYAWDGGPIWGGLATGTDTSSRTATAYRVTYRWLVGAALSSPCSRDSLQVWRCTLSRAGGYRAEVLWSSKPRAIRLSEDYTRAADLAGGEKPISGKTVMVMQEPILVETEILK